jgi:ATP-dependent DNA ligase
MSIAKHDDFVAVPYLRQGQHISLIHWTRAAGEWSYQTVLVEYHHRDDSSWHVVIDGEQVRLNREEWAIFN